MDERLPRDRSAVLSRILALLKSKHTIEFLPEKITEDELLALMETETYTVIVLPWYRYFAWTRVEGAFGTLRMSGSTVAGYFADPILPYELPQLPNYHRGIVLDCLRLDMQEISLMLGLLADPSKRAGITHLLGKETPIYRDIWHGFDCAGPGMLDALLNLPFMHRNPWAARRHNIRTCAQLLWSLVYDLGPGKGDLMSTYASEQERGRIEVGSNQEMLALRMVYTAPEKTPKDFLASFWPDMNRGTEAQQILGRQCDFVKVHVFPETNRVEIVLLFLKGAPSKVHPTELRGFWVEPLSERHTEHADPKDSVLITINRATGKSLAPLLPNATLVSMDPLILMGQIRDVDQAASEHARNLEHQIEELSKKRPDAPEVLILRHKLMSLKQRQFTWKAKFKELLEELSVHQDSSSKNVA